MEWTTLVILILNSVVTLLTNIDVNRKRKQDRSGD